MVEMASRAKSSQAIGGENPAVAQENSTLG